MARNSLRPTFGRNSHEQPYLSQAPRHPEERRDHNRGFADFGAFNVGRYSRFTGLVSTVGSLTLRLRTGVASGSYQVSSNFAANSGASVLDCLNFGQYGYFDITAAQSTVYSSIINATPVVMDSSANTVAPIKLPSVIVLVSRMRNSAIHEALLQLCPQAASVFYKKVFDHNTWKQIKEGSTFKHCEELMRADPDISSHVDQFVGTRISKSRHSMDEYIENFLERVFERQENYRREFDKAYDEFETFFTRDDIDIEIIAPLAEFLMLGSPGFDFGNGIGIRHLPDDVRADFWNLLSEGKKRRIFDLSSLRAAGSFFCLYSIVTEKKLIGDHPLGESNYHKTIAAMDRVVECLRLYQPGNVGCPFIIQRPTVWVPASLGSTWKSGSASIRAAGRNYHVAENKVDELLHFCKQNIAHLNRASEDVQLANRRFNFSYERDIPEDALVDLVVALESLFLEGGSGELGYRMAMRVAGLLSDRGEERQTTFELIHKAYQTRNNIVHGGRPPATIKVYGEAVQFEKFISILEDHVRQSIRKLLEMNLSREQRVKELERRILVG